MERMKCPHLAHPMFDHVSRKLKILNSFEKIGCILTISDTIHSRTSSIYSTFRFKRFLITFFRISGHPETFVMPKVETNYFEKT